MTMKDDLLLFFELLINTQDIVDVASIEDKNKLFGTRPNFSVSYWC